MILRDHHEAFESDLRGQGIDLLDFYRGNLSVRTLCVAVKHLPLTGAVMSAADPDSALIGSFTPTDYVLMNLYDLTHAIAVSGDQFPRYPRPNQMVEERRWREERMALLEQQAERNRLRDAEEASRG